MLKGAKQDIAAACEIGVATVCRILKALAKPFAGSWRSSLYALALATQQGDKRLSYDILD